jgi:hypothetical protein
MGPDFAAIDSVALAFLLLLGWQLQLLQLLLKKALSRPTSGWSKFISMQS